MPRTGAKPGDVVFVSGPIGDAALGLALRRDPALARRLSDEAREYLIGRYLLPQPRVDLSAWVCANASAAMDISDGLAGDLAKLCRASGVSAVVDLASVPLSPAAREAIAIDPALFETAITGGDDYEILIAAKSEFPPAAPACRIGEIVGGSAPPVFSTDTKSPSFSKNCPSNTSEKYGIAQHCRAATFLAESPLESCCPRPIRSAGRLLLFLLRDSVRGDATNSPIPGRGTKRRSKMVLFLTIVFGLMSIVYGVKTSQELLAADPGSARMQEISGAVAEARRPISTANTRPSPWLAA